MPKDEIKDKQKQRVRGQFAEKTRGERWQGNRLTSGWDDEDLSGQECFAWMKTWQRVLTQAFLRMRMAYKRLLASLEM